MHDRVVIETSGPGLRNRERGDRGLGRDSTRFSPHTEEGLAASIDRNGNGIQVRKVK